MAPNYIVKALELSGIEMIGPGVSEIVYGVEQLKKILGRSPIQAVSANVPGFEPYALFLKNNGKTRILVTSVVDPDLLSDRGIEVKGLREPLAAIADVRQQIRHDLFILIVHGNREKIAALVRACPEIDLVIDALSRDVSENPEQKRQPPVVSNNEEGKYVAYVDYQGKNHAGALFSSPVALLADVEQVAEDPGIVELLKDYESKRSAALLHQSKNALASSTDKAFAWEKTDGPYIGSHSCNFCHTEINGQWSKTAHAGAMRTLAAKSKENDPDCVACHVTGMEEKDPEIGTFAVSEVPPFMTGVQCEACHGPGADHSRDPISVDMLSVSEKTCVRCHTQKTDPDFDYGRDVPRVVHGWTKMGYKGP